MSQCSCVEPCGHSRTPRDILLGMPDLRDRIETARARLASGDFANEAAISTGIVLPILDALGWDAFDPAEVAPEYKVRNRRVDFALVANGSPAVFVEVKQPGKADGADRQLFEYAFHEGIPLAVLTDGATWSIYVPSEQGSYEDRRAYHLDLAERSSAESADRLHRYLSRDAVATGDAVVRARRDCQHAKQRKGALSALPQAWANLVAGEDETVLGRLAAEVESTSGYQPERADLVAFLRALQPPSGPLPKAKRKRSALRPTRTAEPPAPTPDLPERGFQLDGRFTPAKSGKDLLVKVFRALADRDPAFLDRFAERKHGRKRRYVAKTREELFPGRPGLQANAAEVSGGYWIGTNNSTDAKRRLIEMAAHVAGVSPGSDLTVRFEP